MLIRRTGAVIFFFVQTTQLVNGTVGHDAFDLSPQACTKLSPIRGELEFAVFRISHLIKKEPHIIPYTTSELLLKTEFWHHNIPAP